MSRVHPDLKIVGEYAGILSSLTFIVFYVSAVLANRDYSITYNYISDLGAGSSAFLFNLGLIISGLLGIVFGFCLLMILDKFGRVGGLLLTASSFFLIGIGAFPKQYEEIHSMMTTLFFTLYGISFFLIWIQLRKRIYHHVWMAACITAFAIAVGFVTTSTQLFEHISVLVILILTVFIAHTITEEASRKLGRRKKDDL